MRRKRPARPDARSLVHDITKKRVEFLGAEINSRGDVTIPAMKVALFQQRVRHRVKYETTGEEDTYFGISKFAVSIPPGEHRGRYRFDPEDVLRTVQNFESYWSDLRAVNLESSIDNYLLSQGLRGAGKPDPHPWVAYLGLPREREGARPGGPPGRVRNHRGSERTATPLTTDEIRSAWQANPIEDQDDEQDDDKNDHGDPLGESMVDLDVLLGIEGPVREGSPDHGGGNAEVRGDMDRDSYDVPTEQEVRSLPGDTPEGAGPLRGDGRHSHERHQPHDTAEGPWSGEGRSGGLSSCPPSDGSEESWSFRPYPYSCCSHSSSRFQPPPPLREQRFGEAPLPRPSNARGVAPPKKRDLYLHRQRMPNERRSVLAWQHVDPDGSRGLVGLERTKGERSESAFVLNLATQLRFAERDGVDLLVVRLSATWLPKTLLQMSRAARSPSFAEALIELHEVAARIGVHVLVGGPVAMPFGVIRACERTR